MGTINIQVEPHELTIGATTVKMQGDPTAGPEWDALMGTPYAVGSRGITELVEALAALAETAEDAEALREMTIGGPTINLATERYIETVTGFPTRPPSSSTKKSKRTGGT